MAFAHAVEDRRCPPLAVAHGLCLTAALELSLACDLLWAARGVQFGLVETVVGITPLMGGTQRMAERAGSGAGARVRDDRRALTPPRRCTNGGGQPRAARPASCSTRRARFAARLAAGPTQAHVATKRIVRAQADHGTRGADERTAELTSHLFETEDTRNAVHSFLEHGPGKARFTGR